MTNTERETVITWTAEDDKATVYSLMPKIWRWCERVGGVEINHEQGIRKGVKEARTFLVDIGCIFIRPRRKVSPEQAKAASARLHEAKRAKSPEGDRDR
jgi:hypothetical protein